MESDGNSYFSSAEISIHFFSTSNREQSDQKSAKRNVKMFSIILQKCCETDFPQSLTRIGHLCASRWLADISRIKPTWVSHLIDCSAFFSPLLLFTISAFLLKCVPSYWLQSCSEGDVLKYFDSAE